MIIWGYPCQPFHFVAGLAGSGSAWLRPTSARLIGAGGLTSATTTIPYPIDTTIKNCLAMSIKHNTSIIVPKYKGGIFLTFACLLMLHACRPSAPAVYVADPTEIYQEAAVVSGHPLASDVGKAILAKGGNAVDAAIAVQFALAVVYPRAGNIGGGGFMVVRQSNGETDALDYREKAPARAHRNMYLDSLENPIEGLSVKGHLAAGVPGTVAGLVAAYERYGSLPWEELVQPAIDHGNQRLLLSPTEIDRLNQFQADFAAYNSPDCPFVRPAWASGDAGTKDLAATLTRIRDQKTAGFYQGETAQLIAAEMQQGNGWITAEDLAAYTPMQPRPSSGNTKTTASSPCRLLPAVALRWCKC
ncbi:MAG: gamma-glutamyltransferase [Saprospiraceae bacterium]